MGATAEFRNLLEHASGGLVGQRDKITEILKERVQAANSTTNRRFALDELVQWVSIVTFTELAMDLVARFLTDDDDDDLTVTTASGEKVVLRPGTAERAAYDVVQERT